MNSEITSIALKTVYVNDQAKFFAFCSLDRYKKTWLSLLVSHIKVRKMVYRLE